MALYRRQAGEERRLPRENTLLPTGRRLAMDRPRLHARNRPSDRLLPWPEFSQDAWDRRIHHPILFGSEDAQMNPEDSQAVIQGNPSDKANPAGTWS